MSRVALETANVNKLTFLGVSCIAKPEIAGCAGCLFAGLDDCPTNRYDPEIPACTEERRSDGRNIIWVKAHG
jgi:hypothetical protein